MKKLILLVFAAVCTFSYLAVLAKESPAQEPAGQPAKARQARWEGMVQRTSKDNSTLTVRKVGSSQEKTIHYDSSTKWVSQEHGAKTTNDIDPSQVKDGDRVICVGWEDKEGFHAALISKRLTKH